MTLLALQQDFRAALLSDDIDLGDASAAGLAVYRNAYRARLMDCLRNSFDKVWSWIGDDSFDAAACHHIILNPPHSWTLDDYGAGFDRTLAELFPDDPEVAELAWLEWAMQRAFASVDEPFIRPTDLASGDLADCDWDNIRLNFVSSLQMRVMTTNCAAIWSAIVQETDPPDLISLDTPVALSVWRKEFSPQFRVLDPNEQEGLSLMLKGVTFGHLCEKMAEHLGPDEAVSASGTMLGRWISEEMVGALRTEKSR